MMRGKICLGVTALIVIVAGSSFVSEASAHVLITGNQGHQLNDPFNVCTFGGAPNGILWILDTTKEISIDTCRVSGATNLYNMCETFPQTFSCASGAGQVSSQSEFDPILPSGDAQIQVQVNSIHRADNGASANSGQVILFWNHIEPSGTLGVSSTCFCGYYVGAEAAVVGSTTAQQTNFYAIWRDPNGLQNGLLLGSIPQVGLNVHFSIDWHRYGSNFMDILMTTNTGGTFHTTLFDSNYPKMNDEHKLTIYGAANIDALLTNGQGLIDNPPTASFSSTSKGKTATFDASSSHDDVVISNYQWNFGDGTPILNTAMAVTSHTYAAKGTYTVTLVCSDDHNYASVPFSKSVTV